MLAEAARPRVAVCFSGFVRNNSLDRSIVELWGPADYDAFVVAPLQHFELDTQPLVDGDALCHAARAQGFRNCKAELSSYDPSFFYSATSDRCLIERKDATYPHRTASMFNGASRCIGAIREAEPAAGRYGWVVITRFDVMGAISMCQPQSTGIGNSRCRLASSHAAAFWPHLESSVDLLAARGNVAQQRIEDRLMLGRRDLMFSLQHVYANYTRDRIAGGAQGGGHGAAAEIYLWAFFHLNQNRRMRIGSINEHFEWDQTKGRNPHRFAHCFFYRVVRALRLGPSELKRMNARFGANYANQSKARSAALRRGCGKSAACDVPEVLNRCHAWIRAYNTSTPCEAHDNKPSNLRLVPGLNGYNERHPESVFVGRVEAQKESEINAEANNDRD
tara:strand:+ start:1084 stop:2256 length:1173 start_codon:yes stop_codon:yes gene_type:complete